MIPSCYSFNGQNLLVFIRFKILSMLTLVQNIHSFQHQYLHKIYLLVYACFLTACVLNQTQECCNSVATSATTAMSTNINIEQRSTPREFETCLCYCFGLKFSGILFHMDHFCEIFITLSQHEHNNTLDNDMPISNQNS